MLRTFCVALLAAAGLAQDDLQTRLLRARDKTLPALVNVQPVMDLYQGGRRRRSTATGSGVIVRDDGLVVTNFHVAGHAKKIYCTLADKTRIPATLLGGDPATDLAVLKLDLKELERLGGSFGVAKLGSQKPVQVGEFVIALGSPRGYSMSLTTGVVSNMQRFLGGNITLPTGEPTGMYNNWIQTDAAINPGNSGGPLVNMEGEVIGINSRGIPGGDGLGFAIPAAVVQRVYQSVVEHGRVIRAWIGVDRGLEPLSLEAEMRGVRIGHVDAGSPAAKAGLKPGDIVLEIASTEVDAVHLDHIPPIRRLIAESPVDRPLKLKVFSGGAPKTMVVTPVELRARKTEQFLARRFGLTARAITPQYARRNGLPDSKGVLVSGVAAGGPAAGSDVRRGDIILKLGKEPVADLDSFRRLYEAIVKRMPKTVLVAVRRGNAQTLRALSPSKRDDEDEDE